jgi:hypothetical protein
MTSCLARSAIIRGEEGADTGDAQCCRTPTLQLAGFEPESHGSLSWALRAKAALKDGESWRTVGPAAERDAVRQTASALRLAGCSNELSSTSEAGIALSKIRLLQVRRDVGNRVRK